MLPVSVIISIRFIVEVYDMKLLRLTVYFKNLLPSLAHLIYSFICRINKVSMYALRLENYGYNNSNEMCTWIDPCYMGASHHSIMHPQVMVGGDGLQIWRIAANTLNKQL
jgi:hypothetical protein